MTIPAGAPAFAGTSYTTTDTYEPDEQKATQVDPAEGGLPAETLRYNYDTQGDLNGFRGLSAILMGTGFTAIGQVGEFYTSGTYFGYEAYGYDPASGLLTNINTQIQTGGIFTNVGNTTYGRDAAGNVTSSKDSVTGQAECFSYDHLSELTQAWTPNSASSCSTTPATSVLGGPAPFWENFTYDTATGNRVTETLHPATSSGTVTTDTYAYPAATAAHPHAVSTVTAAGGTTGTSSYTYDADGSTTTRPGDTITYDATGKPSAIATPKGTQQNVYDASGNLLLSVDPVTGATLYNGDTELHQAVGATAVSATRTYTGANNTPVAERDTVAGQTGNTLYWLFADIDGTVTAQANATTGAVAHRYTDPFGNVIGTPPSSWADDHGYLNKVQDTDTGLTLVGAREYDFVLGRFSSVDPVLAATNPTQNNGYSYSSNNPITNADSSGECYQTNVDSLNFHTNCVHSVGANNGPGAAYVNHGKAPLISGNTSSDYETYAHTSATWMNVSEPGDDTQTTSQSPTPDTASRPWYDSGSYSYHLHQWLGVGLNDYSAQDIADVFKDHPQEIFPFGISGCSRFISGESCRLEGAAPTWWDGSGTVKVRTSATSVTFTVVSNDYFDAPGSTIRFQIVHGSDGFYLDQIARASRSDLVVAAGVGAGAVNIPWETQAANLRQAILKYGHKSQG